MRRGHRVAVVIPALNEAGAIGRVIAGIPGWVDEVVVADNGSDDGTPEVAARAGARVVHEPERGYGAACRRGLAALTRPELVVFLDGDYSDHPDEMGLLVDPILAGEAELVIGSRVLGEAEAGALSAVQRFGNRLACALMRIVWGVRFTDLGPFRAIHWDALQRLEMRDRNYGWTVEMQVKAVHHGLRVREVPVRYRPRIGRSKISGTIRGISGAGLKILYTIFAAAVGARPRGGRVGRGTRLVVFTRFPAPGKVKTRLIPALGAAGAAALHRRLTAETLVWADILAKEDGVDVEVRHDGGSATAMAALFGGGRRYVAQGDGDLGARLERAVATAFAAGYRAVVLAGSDCPDLDAERARDALAALHASPLVVGPATDGGYYLMGLTRPMPALFRDVCWGTETVLAETLQRARDLGVAPVLLPALADVDRPEDLAHVARRDPPRGPASR